MPDPSLPNESAIYNPAADEPDESRYWACIWELLRRHSEFQKDAKLWLDTWNEREVLVQQWDCLTETDRNGPLGKRNHDLRVDRTQTLFAIQNGTLPFITWRASTPSDIPHGLGQIERTDEEQANLLRRRGWHRAQFVLCALKWILPSKLAGLYPNQLILISASSLINSL